MVFPNSEKRSLNLAVGSLPKKMLPARAEPYEDVIIIILDICVAAGYRLQLLVEQQVFHIYVVI